MSYDITDGWEANPGTVFSMHKWKFKAPNMLRMDFKYHQLGNILCPAVKEDREGIGAILGCLRVLFFFPPERKPVRHALQNFVSTLVHV